MNQLPHRKTVIGIIVIGCLAALNSAAPTNEGPENVNPSNNNDYLRQPSFNFNLKNADDFPMTGFADEEENMFSQNIDESNAGQGYGNPQFNFKEEYLDKYSDIMGEPAQNPLPNENPSRKLFDNAAKDPHYDNMPSWKNRPTAKINWQKIDDELDYTGPNEEFPDVRYGIYDVVDEDNELSVAFGKAYGVNNHLSHEDKVKHIVVNNKNKVYSNPEYIVDDEDYDEDNNLFPRGDSYLESRDLLDNEEDNNDFNMNPDNHPLIDTDLKLLKSRNMEEVNMMRDNDPDDPDDDVLIKHHADLLDLNMPNHYKFIRKVAVPKEFFHPMYHNPLADRPDELFIHFDVSDNHVIRHNPIRNGHEQSGRYLNKRDIHEPAKETDDDHAKAIDDVLKGTVHTSIRDIIEIGTLHKRSYFSNLKTLFGTSKGLAKAGKYALGTGAITGGLAALAVPIIVSESNKDADAKNKPKDADTKETANTSNNGIQEDVNDDA